jgi:hypothetical protein
VADYHDELEDWATTEARADPLIAPLVELWPLLGDLGSRHSPQTRRFVANWITLTTDPHRAIGDAGLVARIQEREFEVKKRQARLSFAAAEETWRGAAGAGQLEYRWNSTQRQLLDIVTPAVARCSPRQTGGSCSTCSPRPTATPSTTASGPPTRSTCSRCYASPRRDRAPLVGVRRPPRRQPIRGSVHPVTPRYAARAALYAHAASDCRVSGGW